MKAVSIREFRNNLKECLDNTPVAITKYGQVVAVLVKPRVIQNNLDKMRQSLEELNQEVIKKNNKLRLSDKRRAKPKTCPTHGKARLGDYYACGCKVK